MTEEISDFTIDLFLGLAPVIACAIVLIHFCRHSLSSSYIPSLTHSLAHSLTPSLVRINNVPLGVLVTPEQKADPSFLTLKWVLLFAPQLRRWRLGLVISRLQEGYIGQSVSVCVCVCMCVCVCVHKYGCAFVCI